MRHFTASAFVINDAGRTLLLWHKRNQRWMPPGGHVDENEIPEDAAVRECREETGLDVELLTDEDADLFAANSGEGRMLHRPRVFLLEEIAASTERHEPAHQHMDFVYVAKPKDSDAPLILEEHEGTEIRWFTRAEIVAIPDGEMYANVKAFLLSLLPK